MPSTKAPPKILATNQRGSVRTYLADKGYGFIRPDGGDRMSDVFVHQSAIMAPTGEGRTLKQGQRVTYDVTEGEKGRRAVNVVVIG